MLNGIQITKDVGVVACLIGIVIREVPVHPNRLPCLVDAVVVEEHKNRLLYWELCAKERVILALH